MGRKFGFLAASFHTLHHRWLTPVGRVLAGAGITPNTLTILGFIANVGAAAVLGLGHFLGGGLLVLFSGAFDMLDGAVARASGRVTRFGGFLDSTLDRLSEAAILFGLFIWYARRDSLQELVLIYLTLVGSLLVSYTRARAEGLGLECKVGILTRAERVILLAAGLIFGFALPVLWVLAVLTNFTVVQRILHVWRRTNRGRDP
ncbi:MAG: CDP-alcohol phosphatidyltransferase family protein [Chloroflexi bacterium]|nr:CDP-alcohol phosphatidyltransferase family protein [Chloroflexota bacterium]